MKQHIRLVLQGDSITDAGRDKRNYHDMGKGYPKFATELIKEAFPNVDFETEGEFDIDEECEADYFDPDTGELILGDIVISADKVYSQAEEYGHSVKRELAFLVAHSMLHLFGYDHIDDEERIVMEAKQKEILDRLGITRE